ncbi:hypothetical protein PEPS_07690 [Persicobacter psychrovividus]|uniref:Uncharacterized protein n=1 Tax=Persicobacter psychrovividus TaxID=387638 RepID=A0ABM7VC58_9BACT|nr:hypothetical protein PEPS_07690 [Persicobacter psychrovividus]
MNYAFTSTSNLDLSHPKILNLMTLRMHLCVYPNHTEFMMIRADTQVSPYSDQIKFRGTRSIYGYATAPYRQVQKYSTGYV